MRRSVVAVVLAVAVVVAVPASAAAFGSGNAAWKAYYASPGDQTKWNAFCQGGGGTWVLTDVSVPACSPTGSTPIYIPNSSGGNGPYTPGFQCVELVERYLYVTRGWPGIGVVNGKPTNGAQVVKNYAAAHGMTPFLNGTAGQSPAVGDVLSFSGNSNFSDTGHTSVVTAASVDGNGNGTVTMVGENQTSGHASSVTMSVSGWTIKSWDSSLTHIEWLHLGSANPGAFAFAGQADFNGDGVADFAVDSGGQWAVKSGKAPYSYIAQGVSLGGPGCAAVVGDFNGDGASDFAVDCGGQWAVKSGKAPYSYIAQGVSLGDPGCTPVVGDFNGDGASDFAVDCGGQWAVKSGKAPYSYIAQGVGLGGPGDIPL